MRYLTDREKYRAPDDEALQKRINGAHVSSEPGTATFAARLHFLNLLPPSHPSCYLRGMMQ